MSEPIEPVEEIEYRGYKIQVLRDLDPWNPRELNESLGTMICFHRRHSLGDKHEYRNPEAFLEEYSKENIIMLPLYLMDHSGIGMNTYGFRCCDPAGWDWGQVGWIYATKERAKKEFNWKKLNEKRIKFIETHLCSEVEDYDNYLRGNIYGFYIEDVDSCWGYSGNYQNTSLIADAKSAVDAHIRKVGEQSDLFLKKEKEL